MPFKFPDDFYWGTASSAYQVEGNNHNDISEWELKHAPRLANQAENSKSRWSAWQKEKFPEMFDPKNYISGLACDHYHRFEDDFDLAQKLHNNALRLSLEWARIEPAPGKFDQNEINHYKKVVLALKNRGLEPFVTLWHFTSPSWLYNSKAKGGWDNDTTTDYFLRYVQKMAEVFQNEVKFWIILNEPEVYSAGVYLTNLYPPRGINPIKFWLMFHRFITTHQKAYHVIKTIIPHAQIGIAKSYWYFEPAKNNWLDNFLARIANYLWNHYFLDKINKELDFVGANVYDYIDIGFGHVRRARSEHLSDMGFPQYPRSIYHVLIDAKRFHKPIYVTENGISDATDRIRPWFLREYLKNVAEAVKDGADVRGYFHWSLTDNFEWNKGFWPRLGLFAMDYKTMTRTPRSSSKIYAKICQDNAISLN